MTKVSIIEQGINNLNSIRKKLEERDAIVSIVKNYNDLNNLDTNTLLIAKELVESPVDAKLLTELALAASCISFSQSLVTSNFIKIAIALLFTVTWGIIKTVF